MDWADLERPMTPVYADRPSQVRSVAQAVVSKDPTQCAALLDTFGDADVSLTDLKTSLALGGRGSSTTRSSF